MSRYNGSITAAALILVFGLIGCSAPAAAASPTAITGGGPIAPPTAIVVPPGSQPTELPQTPPPTPQGNPPDTPTVTMADDNTTITLAVGHRALLMLMPNVDWKVTIADESIISHITGSVMIPADTQGYIQANKPGTTTLLATGSPACPTSAPCPTYLIRFMLTVVVQ